MSIEILIGSLVDLEHGVNQLIVHPLDLSLSFIAGFEAIFHETRLYVEVE